MSELKSILYRDQEEDRQFEIQFFPDAVYFSIEFNINEGMNAESFKLTAREARNLAEEILKIIPDPAILEDNLDAI